MGLGQLAHSCAGCPVFSLGEKLGVRQGEKIRPRSGMDSAGGQWSPQVSGSSCLKRLVSDSLLS